MNQRFEDNLKKLTFFYPEITPSIIPFKEESNHYCQTDAGELNLKIEQGCYHSQKNAQEEANNWFQSLKLNETTLLFVYGLGLGYGYLAAKKWLDENPERYIVFIEQSPLAMTHFLATETATEMLDNWQIRILYCTNPSIEEGLVQKIINEIPLRSIDIVGSPYFNRHRPGIVDQKKAGIYLKYQISIGLLAEYLSWGEAFFTNFYNNLIDFSELYHIKPFLKAFQGLPAIVCGAGPSLNKNRELLKTLSDRAIIFAGGTSMNALNAVGILPHFGFGVDPNWSQFTRLIANTAFEVPFIFRTRINHQAFRVIHGPKIYLPGTGGYNVGEWIDEKFGIEPLEMTEGMNVVHLSLSLAYEMGCNPVACIGLDLAYSGSESYAEGIQTHALHSRQKDFKTKGIEDELLVKDDIYGNPVNTQWRWVAESNWYPYLKRMHPELNIINATEGGIGLPSIKNSTLKEFSDTYLKNSYDISGWIHALIQESHVSMKIAKGSFYDFLTELKTSLETTAQQTRDLTLKYLSLSSEAKNGQENTQELDSEEITEIKNKLKEEISYKYVLNVFEERFNRIYCSRLNEIEHNRKRFPLEKVREEKLLMKAAQYEFVFQAAVVNISVILGVLNKINSRKKVSDIPSETIYDLKNSPKENVVYEYKDLTLTINDPEFGLNVTENFIPNRELVEYFPNGNVKFKTYYKNGNIHGPSRFWSEIGVLLSETWYLEGRKVGRTYTYYYTGAAYAQLTYKDGELHGKQYYFYPDGKIKSILSYVEGAYDGDVDLYYSNGVKQRHLEFKNGLKHGEETMWNEAGSKIISAQYKEGKPIGIAREWYDNGGLSREVVYDNDSIQKELHTWTPSGKEYSQGFSSGYDYFDKLTIETRKLTDSLDTLLHQLTEISKSISATDNPELKAELERLNQEFEKLRQCNKKITDESGLLNQDSKEILWKTPLTKKITGDQIQLATDSLSKDLQAIHNALSKIIDQIIPKPENKEDKHDNEKSN